MGENGKRQLCRALWNGTGPTILRLSVGLGLQMCVLESLKEAFRWRHVGLAEEGTGTQKRPGLVVLLHSFSIYIEPEKTMCILRECICRSCQESHPCSAGHSPGKLTKLEAFLCGGLARTVAAAATCPFTLVKTRMEYTGGSQPGQVVPSLCAFQAGYTERLGLCVVWVSMGT